MFRFLCKLPALGSAENSGTGRRKISPPCLFGQEDKGREILPEKYHNRLGVLFPQRLEKILKLTGALFSQNSAHQPGLVVEALFK